MSLSGDFEDPMKYLMQMDCFCLPRRALSHTLQFVIDLKITKQSSTDPHISFHSSLVKVPPPA